MAPGDTARVVAGRYELLAALGHGGMGTVWRARDTELDREVALKEVRLPAELSDSEKAEAHARVRREARSAARLSDEPGVITVYDVVDFEEHPWVVMQLVQGRSLQEMLRDHGPMPPAQAVRMARSMLEALRAAHGAGVVHRDVKPGNVMLAHDGRTLLTDFGIATIDGETAVTRTGSLVGSPEYMAPERLEAGGAAEPPSDMWSLGATLYTAVQGEALFRRDTVPSVVAAVMSAQVTPPPRGAELTPLIMALLQRDPTRRPSPDQALALLPDSGPQVPMAQHGAAGAAAPSVAAPPPAAPASSDGQRSLGRGPLLAIGAGALAVVLLGVGLFWWLNRPVSTEYDWHRTDSYSVRYPVDWDVEENEDDADQIVHPDEELRMSYTVGAYSPDEEDDTADDELARLTGPSAETNDYQQSELDLAEIIDEWPSDWDVAAVEETYTLDEEYVDDELDVDPEEIADLDTFRIRLQIHVPDEDADGPGFSTDDAYWVSWIGPQSERDRYDDVIFDVLGSFQPNP